MKKNKLLKLLLSGLCFMLCFSCTKKPELDAEDPIVEEKAILDETISARLPHVFINTVDEAEVVDKEIYLNGEVYITSNTSSQDLAKQSTRIKGRGNSTWVLPKKPYRLKLDKKSSILGLAAAKDWILLANYNDYTLMTNAVSMFIGKQLAMPFTNDIIAVDLTINGIYRGNYNLTQQIEINENRVNVGDDGVLWELDSYFDEDWKFKSTHYNLPVMLKDPDVDSDSQFESWKNEFQSFENLVASSSFPNNNYGNVFDKQQFVNFLIVNSLVANHEINHPKSTFIHKKAAGKYTMGPLWDFDYAFGFSEEHQNTYFNYVNLSVVNDKDKRVGSEFYKRLLEDPEIRSLFSKTWEDYKKNKFEDLMRYVEVFAASIRESQKKDYAIWKVGNNNHAQNKADLKTFLRKRVLVIDDLVKNF